MKRKLVALLMCWIALLASSPVYGQMNEETKDAIDVLYSYIQDVTGYMEQHKLLERKELNGDYYWYPTLINLNEYWPPIGHKESWSVVLYMLAYTWMNHSSEYEEMATWFTEDDKTREILTFSLERAADIAEAYSDVAQLSEAYAKDLPFREQVGSILREIDHKVTGIGGSNYKYVTFKNIFNRFGKMIFAFSILIEMSELNDELLKINMIADNIVANYILVEDVIPILKKQNLYKNNQALREAIDSIEQNTISPNMVFDNAQKFASVMKSAATVTLSVAGLSAFLNAIRSANISTTAVLVSIAISVLGGIIADKLSESHKFALNLDLSGKLFTLSRDLSEKDVFTRASALKAGLELMEAEVIGKGFISSIADLIGIGAEHNWRQLFKLSSERSENVSWSFSTIYDRNWEDYKEYLFNNKYVDNFSQFTPIIGYWKRIEFSFRDINGSELTPIKTLVGIFLGKLIEFRNEKDKDIMKYLEELAITYIDLVSIVVLTECLKVVEIGKSRVSLPYCGGNRYPMEFFYDPANDVLILNVRLDSIVHTLDNIVYTGKYRKY